MIDLKEQRTQGETAVLIGLITDDQSVEQVKEYLQSRIA